jgi:DNA gyrase/topoisomerase IV subunit B
MRGKSLGNMLYRDEIRVMLNKSLAGLMQAAGLSFVKSKLRYNKLVMAQDADFDGYSILGLNLVFFNKFFPECLENGHIYRLKTPIIIARLGNDFRRYYSLSDFHSEEEMLTNAGYQIKYHKGLASLADREYELMMANPMLSKITKDDLSDAAIMNWFGNDSDIRKELMNILAEIDEMSEDDKVDYFNENVIVHFDEL